MNLNNHSGKSDADLLRQVDRLIQESAPSGDPLLDNIRVHIPRLDSAQSQILEDDLISMWEANQVTAETLEGLPASSPAFVNRRSVHAKRAGRLPYITTVAAMLVVVTVIMLLNQPSSPETASQSVITAAPIMTRTPVVVTATPALILGPITTPTLPLILGPRNTIVPAIDPIYITATYVVERATATQAANLTLTAAPATPISVIAPMSLLIPRDAQQPRRLAVGDRIQLYVGIVEFSSSGEAQPFDESDLLLLAADVEVTHLLDYADEYGIAIPEAILPVLRWLWADGQQKYLLYEVE